MLFMKRAAIYARVSTTQQSETSIETQIEAVKKFCESHDIEVVDIFSDKESGSKVERTNFSKMIENALNGKYDLIVVDKFDRFFRNDVEDRIITRRLEEKSVLVLSATEGVDVSSPSGKLMRWILSDINSFYRDNLRSEITRKSIAVAKRGFWMGGNPAYGFSLVEIKDSEGRKRKKLVVNEKEAVIVKRIFEMSAGGVSYRKIALQLNQEGLRTRNGTEWKPSTISDLLRNPRYYGANAYMVGAKGKPHLHREDTVIAEGAIPAIVSKELWQKVNGHHRTISREKKNTFILKNIIFCGVCGARMTTSANRYMCENYANGRDTHYVAIAKKKAEDFVMGYIRNEIMVGVSEMDFEKMAQEYNQQLLQKDKIKAQRISQLQSALADTEIKIQNATQAILAGLLTEELSKQIKFLETDREHIKEELVKLATNSEDFVKPEDLRAHWMQLKNMLDNPESHEKLVKALIEKIIVYPKGYIKIVEK